MSMRAALPCEKDEMPGTRPGITIPKYAQTDKVGPCGVVAAGFAPIRPRRR